MLYVMYLVLFLYSLPLTAIIVAVIALGLFGTESRFIYIAGTISITFLKQLWETFGNLAVPLITAFSIPIRGPDQKIPRQTLVLISVLALGFILSISLLGIISSYQENIETFGSGIYAAFSDVTVSYVKGFLSYFALTLGISFKR